MVYHRRRGTAIVDTPKGILVVSESGRGYLLPGGNARKGESRRKAAIRELEEETGLKATDVIYLFEIKGGIHKNRKGHSFRTSHKVFLVKTIGTAKPKGEIKHLAYVKDSNLLKLSQSTKTIIERYNEIKNLTLSKNGKKNITSSKCYVCGKEELIPFKCTYCGGFFCAEHRLPETHNCTRQPKEKPYFAQPSKYLKPAPVANYYSKKKYSKTRPTKKIAVFFIIVILIGVLFWYVYFIPQQSAQNPSTANTPILTTTYVEVNYRTIGWFYSTAGKLLDPDYNSTYLVLNVTITNHGYSQVNIIGNNGFSVLINDSNYPALISNPILLYNSSTSFLYHSFDNPKLPNQAILLDTGNITGIITFQFGDPNVYPQQPQIFNEPFNLQYLVSYGDEVPLYVRQVYQLGPYAKVVVDEWD